MRAAKQANRRIRLLLVLFALGFAGLVVRAFWLQVVQGASYQAIAESQHYETTTTPASRGTIFDRNGVQLAIGEQTTTVFADPEMVRNAALIARDAQRVFGVSPTVLYPELRDKKSQFVYIQRFADPDQAKAFMKLKLAGVDTEPEEKRFYPQGSVGAQVVGYAGTDDTGLGGLELQYNSRLAGHAGKQTIVRDPIGRTIDIVKSSPAQPGTNVFTTIDSHIQANAEQVLRATVAQWGAKDATAIVLDPSTGEVLAMAQAPGYNANDTNEVSPGLQLNRAVSDTYEPGSTFKVVTVTGALSEGLVKPSTTFVLPPCIQVANYCIHDAEERGTVTYSVAQILKYSSNVGAITLAEKLGGPTLERWIYRFGFGKDTGIDFPGESPGDVLPYLDWSGSTIGNVPIGQGVSVTPIQMASVYAAIANDGVWVQPHLVDRVGGRAPEVWKRRRIMSDGVDRELRQMLTGVVQDGGTGVAAAIPGYTVAGKTGTAQKPNGHGGYSNTNFVASFVGMVPASKPRLVVLVTVDEPRGSIFGGTVAAPAFAAIAKFDLQYLEVPPDVKTGASRTTLANG
jgi:cell division protein FtsI (penicillin-binding protein 3)/stage V sporulation protein D (sporulation-specific penicillin-binding protein)